MSFASFVIDRYFIKQPRFRRAVTRMVFGKSDRTASIFDLDLYINSQLESGYLRAAALSRKSSLLRDEVSVLMNLCALLSDGDTFVDIGANIGIFSSVMARAALLRENVRVIAFDADPSTAARLKVNADRHGFTAINAGISDHESRATFVRGSASHITTQLDRKNEHSIASETFEIECKPLSSFEIPGKSLILKIDVEGMELEVLKGAWSMVDDIKAIYIDGMTRQDEIYAMLTEAGFKFRDGRTAQPIKAGDPIFSLLAIR